WVRGAHCPRRTASVPSTSRCQRGHAQLAQLLAPVYRRSVPLDLLAEIQTHFHATIRERAASLVDKHALRLPELAILLEVSDPRMSFPVPGMYGGFYYSLATDRGEATLVVDSWSRVVYGSGQRHEISAAGSRLVDEGFV
ncbi:MAG: ankyrin repeat domain-containing protein, partial [Caldilineaceae bacterium]|nr:ankyrin repeat domain-containing protein [Caldilineaceae bacterium]